MKTISVMVKCDLGKAYTVADEAVLNIEFGLWTFSGWRSVRVARGRSRRSPSSPAAPVPGQASSCRDGILGTADNPIPAQASSCRDGIRGTAENRKSRSWLETRGAGTASIRHSGVSQLNPALDPEASRRARNRSTTSAATFASVDVAAACLGGAAGPHPQELPPPEGTTAIPRDAR